MAWPLSQDFNEAIQNPSTAFADADLKSGTVTTTPLGVPLPRSGNYADVYQVIGADGRAWALKCFTRAVAPDLQARYAAIAGHLAETNLPFTVGFEFLANGIRVKGKTYPALKMQWVEGSALNTFVKDNLGRATILESMLSLWVRLCRRLRETGMAHCDLQHGNVILVPAEKSNSLGLKLVDYDGVFVPALAGKNPGEAGHASFQHPQRIITNDYSANLDRFPHLVVATALRGLLVGGKDLWDKYDTGDNLLFTAKDFTSPKQSKVLRELWDTSDPFTVGLVSHLVIAASKPLAQTPWLDTLMPEGRPPVLTPSQERQAMQLLGLPVQSVVPQAAPRPVASQPRPAVPKAVVNPDLGFEPEIGIHRHPAHEPKKSANTYIYGAIAFGVILLSGLAAFLAFGGKSDSGSAAQAEKPTPPASAVEPVKAPPKTGPVVEPVPPVVPPVVPPATANAAKLLWSMPTAGSAAGVVYTVNGSKILVPMSGTGQVAVHDAKSGNLITTYIDPTGSGQTAVAPLPDGKVLSIASDPVAIVWDDTTGRAVARAFPHGATGAIDLLQTDRDGKHALMAAGAKASVIDLGDHKELLALDLIGAGTSNRAAARLAPDGTQVLSISKGGKLATHALPGGTATEVPLALANPAVIVAWCPEKNLAILRAALSDTRLHVVNTTTGATIKSLQGYIAAAEFTPAGDAIVATTITGEIQYLDPATFAVKSSILAKSMNSGSNLAVSPSGTTAAFVSSVNRTLFLVSPTGLGETAAVPTTAVSVPADVQHLAVRYTLQGAELNGANVVSADVDRDGKRLFYTDGIKVFGRDMAEKVDIFSSHEFAAVRKLWVTDAGIIAQVLNAEKQTELTTLNGAGMVVSMLEVEGKEPVHSIAVSASGGHAAVNRTNGDVSVYDIKGKKHIDTIQLWDKDPAPADPTVSAFWPEPARQIYIWRGKRMQIYPLTDLKQFTPFAPGGPVVGVDDISSDGRLIAFRLHAAGAANTQFFLKQTGDAWAEKGIGVPTPGAGDAVAFRFLGNGGCGVVVAPGRVTIVDTATGKPTGKPLLTRQPESVTGATINAGRTALTIFGGPYVSVLTSATAAEAVAQAPTVPDKPAVKARKPIPDEAAIKIAELTVKDIFKALYAKRLLSDRRKLAEMLLKTAEETTNDAAAKYFLLTEVQSIAVELADSQMGSKAIELEAAEFDVDGTAMRIALLEKIASTATKVEVLRNLSETCSEMVEELVDQNEFENAIKVATVGITALRHANLNLMARDLEIRQTQIRKQQEAYQPVKAALEVLKTKPQDAAANAVVGRYRCLILGRWTDGLPNLAAGDDDALKTAATLDLEVDPDVTEMKRAEAWWTWGQAQQEPEKSAALNRAKFWYAKIIDHRERKNRARTRHGGKPAGLQSRWRGIQARPHAGSASRRQGTQFAEGDQAHVDSRCQLQRLQSGTARRHRHQAHRLSDAARTRSLQAHRRRQCQSVRESLLPAQRKNHHRHPRPDAGKLQQK